MREEIEVLEANGIPFERAVWLHHGSRCVNCGETDRLVVRLVVPEDLGGQVAVSNSVLLCRTCDFACDLSSNEKEPSRAVNFFMSRELYERLRAVLKGKNRYNSLSSLVRYLMVRFVDKRELYSDLVNYQDVQADVKVNVWVGKDTYMQFKGLARGEGLTVTETTKALLMMWLEAWDEVGGRNV